MLHKGFEGLFAQTLIMCILQEAVLALAKLFGCGLIVNRAYPVTGSMGTASGALVNCQWTCSLHLTVPL